MEDDDLMFTVLMDAAYRLRKNGAPLVPDWAKHAPFLGSPTMESMLDDFVNDILNNETGSFNVESRNQLIELAKSNNFSHPIDIAYIVDEFELSGGTYRSTR